MPIPTPEEAPDGLQCLRIYCPNGVEYRAALWGIFRSLGYEWTWKPDGNESVEDTASIFLTAFEHTISFGGPCVAIGTVLFTAGNALPDNALWADGAEVSQAEWPLLYDVLGNTWGTASPGNFKLPNMQRRFPVGAGSSGAGTYAVGDMGGEETHMLITAEIPAHTHEVHAHETGVIGVELLPASTPALLPGETGSAGGGGAHENRPPYAALNAYIIAR